VDEAKLLAFLQQGGRALFLARSAAQAALGVTLENAPDLGRAPDLPDWPELAGLSASDLRARTPYEAWIVKSGAEVAAGGLFARKAVGQGVALFCQIDPLRFDTEQEPYFRFTRWRHTRALAQVLANLGAGLALDPFVALGRSPVDRLSIAGSWRVKAFGLVPGTKNIAQRIALAPLSEEATAAVATGADDSAWDQAAVPGMWSGFTEMDGEAVFRTRVSIPPEWAGRDLTLSLGAVDDFDVTFWNGEKVAEGEGWNKPRTYTVPEKLVKVGVNILAVRVFDNYLGGGFGAQSPGEMFVAPRERKSEDLGGYYDPDYRTDFEFGDDPYRYWRW
jgi:beta-galactosidase